MKCYNCMIFNVSNHSAALHLEAQIAKVMRISLLTEMKILRIKLRYFTNGNPQSQSMDRDRVSSQTETTKASLHTGVIQAIEV